MNHKYYYTDNREKYHTIDGEFVGDYITGSELDFTKPILIRKQKTKGKWQPKVGEECLWEHRKVTPKLLEPDCDGDIVFTCEGEYAIANLSELKPLPPEPTEEEKLIEEMCDIFENAACKQTYSMVNGMQALIEVGYRKVEPIDYDKLLDLCVSKSPAYVCDYLTENNHIIAKEN